MFLRVFLNNLERYSNKNAFCIQDVFYSYEDFRATIAQVYWKLQDPSLKVNNCVAIVCEDDMFTYAAIIALWLSGKGYVPLGKNNPHDRNKEILEMADSNAIISASILDERIYESFHIVLPDNKSVDYQPLPTHFNVNSDSLAYLLFTSGSTGSPKGVPITFANLDAFINAFDKIGFNVDSNDRYLQMYELTFDISVVSYLYPLFKGGCVYTVPNNGVKYVHILKLIQKYNLTFIHIVPSVIELAKLLLRGLKNSYLKHCFLAGEALNMDLVRVFKDSFPNCSIWNFYGPTEASIYCTYYRFDPNESTKSHNGILSIGKPLDMMEALIIDESGKDLNVGLKGELIISGPQVTYGYLNNPSRNAEAFIIIKDKRYYKTGDLCFMDQDGDLFYCGRIDNQVKIQGYRVELGEIEFHIRSKFECNCCVLAINRRTNVFELVAFIEGHGMVEDSIIIEYLASKLPSYMVPSKVLFFKEFPLNTSGKIDKKKLKEAIYE